MESRAGAIFSEEQLLRSHKVMIVTLPVGLALIGIFGYAMVEQLILGKPFTDDPLSDPALMVIGPLYIALGVFLLYLYFGARLITQVRPEGVYVRFVPFHRRFKNFTREQVVGCEAVTYRPIRDYGGWGIRYGRKGRAYNTHGNRGVRLEFQDGKSLMVGSQKADSLASAINSIRR